MLGSCGGDSPRPMPSGESGDSGAIADWLNQLEPVDESYPGLTRAREIFRKVQDASGQLARLEVRHVSTGPAAMALANGVVLISPESLDFAFHDVSDGEGDARFAFLASHELAHLKHNDFWHFRAFSPAAAQSLRDLVSLDTRNRQVLEAKADGEGMLAAMAGDYDVSPLFGPESNFFAEWVGAVPGRFDWNDPNYPSPSDRRNLIVEQLNEIRRQVRLFDDGVRAFREAEVASRGGGIASIEAAEEKYLEAIGHFERFRQHFEGREVLSNLAVAHLRIASAQLAQCEGVLVTRFYLRSIIDEETLASRRVNRGSFDAFDHCYEVPRYRTSIADAIDLLELAVGRDESYLPARINLATAYLVDRQDASAREQAYRALAIAPDDPRVLELDAVAHLLAADLGDRRINKEAVLEDLGELHRQFPEDPAIAFNLASALSYDPSHGLDEAESVWRTFLRLEPEGPWAEIARGWVGEEPESPANEDQPAR